MKRIFAISDIHGQYEAMQALFEYVSFDARQDRLVVVGDLIDRGPHSGKVVRYVKDLQDTYPQNIDVVIGNHEIMMRDYVFEGRSHMWLRYGGYECIADFNTAFETEEERNEHLVWLANLPLTAEDEQFFYAHAGIDPFYALDEQDDRDVTFMKINELYYFTREDFQPIIGQKKMVHGHTPYQCVYDTGGFISCDLGASVLEEGQLALVELTNNRYYAYDFTNNGIRVHTIETLTKEARLTKTTD